MRRDLAQVTAGLCHVEDGVGALSSLRTGVRAQLHERKPVAADGRGGAGLGVDGLALLHFVDRRADEAGNYDRHADVGDQGAEPAAAAAEHAPQPGQQTLVAATPADASDEQLQRRGAREGAHPETDQAADTGRPAPGGQGAHGDQKGRRRNGQTAQDRRGLGVLPVQQRAHTDRQQGEHAQRPGKSFVGGCPHGLAQHQGYYHSREHHRRGKGRQADVGDVVEEVARGQALQLVLTGERLPAAHQQPQAHERDDDQEAAQHDQQHGAPLEGVHGADHAAARHPCGQDSQPEGDHGQRQGPVLEQTAAPVEREGVQHGGGREPRDEGGVLDGVPAPIAAPGQDHVGPPGTQADAEREEEPAAERPPLRALHPLRVAAPLPHGGHRKGEGNGQTDVAQEQRRRMQHHRGVKQQRVEAGRDGAGRGGQERVRATVHRHEGGK